MRVVIADGQQLVLSALRAALDGAGGLQVVGETRHGSRLLGLVRQAQPDLVVLERALADVDGLTLLPTLRSRFPHVPVVVLAADDEEQTVATALARGAAAFISKIVRPAELPALLRRAAAEDGPVVHAPRAAVAPELAALSDREREVLRLVATGLTNKEIARRLWLAEATVKFHLSNVYSKVGVANRAQAAAWAHERGLQ